MGNLLAKDAAVTFSLRRASLQVKDAFIRGDDNCERFPRQWL
ncbi:MAG: hypothetical protein V7L25_02135 [Nostoc sp.]